MTRLVARAAITVLGLATLTGCAMTSQIDTSPREVKLDNGTTVTCVLAIDSASGGSASPSCNWERYNQQHPVESGPGHR